jgi:septum formation protein
MLRLDFRVVVPDVDESRRGGEAPGDYVVRVAREKAAAVAAGAADALVLAADTAVVLDAEVFGKPADPGEARAMLRRLAGRTHRVMTGVAAMAGGRAADALDVSAVTFRPLDDATIAQYVETGEPLDKAGAYAIQGVGAALVERVEGDFFGVMGLPLRLALDLLAGFGRPYRFTR